MPWTIVLLFARYVMPLLGFGSLPDGRRTIRPERLIGSRIEGYMSIYGNRQSVPSA